LVLLASIGREFPTNGEEIGEQNSFSKSFILEFWNTGLPVYWGTGVFKIGGELDSRRTPICGCIRFEVKISV
jgi:hypothetical protein